MNAAQSQLRRRAQQGAASLVVVLMLFFVIALVAAYTSRNLIFEQRTSVNQYRSTMAFEAADAGLEWALALVNAGRVGSDCTEATANAGSNSFRRQMLGVDNASGAVAPLLRPAGGELRAGCVWTGTAWLCHCPANGQPVLAAPTTPGLHPAFRVRFVQANPNIGAVRIEVNACVRMEENCLDDFDGAQNSEGRAQHSVLAVLKPALSTLPAAALTVVGKVVGKVAGCCAAQLTNSEPGGGGLTIHAAGDIKSDSFELASTPGTPPQLSTRKDTDLVPSGLALDTMGADPANWDRVFGSAMGLLPNSYRNQPAAHVLNCPAAGCRQALSDWVAKNPDRVVWIPGDLTLESAGDIGSLPDPANPGTPGPAMIVVDGNVIFSTPGVRIFGVVYARKGAWTGKGEITGAALVEGDLAASAEPTVTFNQAVVNAARRSSGSFVALSGGWRDFK